MQRPWQLVAVVLGPGLLSGLSMVAHAFVQSFLFGDCDMKFGCIGGVQFAAFLGTASLILSSIGFFSATLIHRSALTHMKPKWVVVLVLVLTAALTAMLYTVGYWAVESVALTLVLWVVISAFICWTLLTSMCLWVPDGKG